MDYKSLNESLKKTLHPNIKTPFDETTLLQNPFEQFVLWYHDALEIPNFDPSAMVLATVDENNRPDTRVVLLKEVHEHHFIFYTNYNSKKGQHLQLHPFAALNFFWPALARQIRIRGTVAKITREKSEAYFNSRPRMAQLSAYVSDQSQMISDPETIRKKIAAVEVKFIDKPIPCPAHWGGYCLNAEEYEFFQAREGRIHDRFLYSKTGEKFTVVRLSP